MKRVHDFWEARFNDEKKNGAKPEDWVVGSSEVLHYVVREMKGFEFDPKSTDILLLACGTSPLVAKLHDLGWQSITCTDISESAIAIQKDLHGKTRPKIHFQVADASRLSEIFPKKRFDVVIDKTGIDSIMFRSKRRKGPYIARRVFGEISKVLKSSGVFLMVSTSKFRTHLLLEPDTSPLPVPGAKRKREVSEAPKTIAPWELLKNIKFKTKSNVKFEEAEQKISSSSSTVKRSESSEIQREKGEGKPSSSADKVSGEKPPVRYARNHLDPHHRVHIYVTRMR
mmetsp:Transcript_15947/g.24037  ORF Transcript_15947/g.24037 Transcript_15947/m.24037 type:complete len:284 (-) Transcript_15947:208-1059(-)